MVISQQCVGQVWDGRGAVGRHGLDVPHQGWRGASGELPDGARWWAHTTSQDKCQRTQQPLQQKGLGPPVRPENALVFLQNPRVLFQSICPPLHWARQRLVRPVLPTPSASPLTIYSFSGSVREARCFDGGYGRRGSRTPEE